MRELDDLDFDGVVILPKRVINGCRDGKIEKCTNRILQFSGNIKKARMPKWLYHCKSLPEVLGQLMKKQIWPSVEIIYDLDGKIETDFFIGPVAQIENDEFWIHDYDAAGKWGYEWFIRFDEIYKIQFDGSYSDTFNEFMQSIERPTPKRYEV